VIGSIPKSLEDLVSERRTALLVYDMQVGIVRQVEGADEIVMNVGILLKEARKARIPIFFTRHMSLPLELMGTFQLRQAMAWQRVERPDLIKPWFLRDSPQIEIVPELAPLPSEGVVDKITMAAFEGTYLPFALRDLGIDSFIIAGIAMEVGIEPTVRHATDLGFIPIVAADACGSGNQSVAQSCLELIRYAGDAIISDAKSICGLLSSMKSS